MHHAALECEMYNMKSIALSAILALGIGSAAHAKTVTLDTFLGSAELDKANPETEIAELETLLKLTAGSLEFDNKFEETGLTYSLATNKTTDGDDIWYVDVTPDTPGWFILKFGVGNTGIDNTYFFENIADFSILAFANDGNINNLLDGCTSPGSPTDCKLSHVTTVVPLPAGAILLITALGGLGIAARRRRKSS